MDLEAAREAHARHDWPALRDGLVALDEPLEPDAATLLADAHWWLGEVDEAMARSEEAYRGHLAAGRRDAAANDAMLVAVVHFLRGQEDGMVWVGRAREALAGLPEQVIHAQLFYFVEVEAALGEVPALDDEQFAVYLDKIRHVRDLGRRHDDANLITVAAMAEGRALVKRGRVRDGLARLDEARAALLSDDLLPDWAGNVYCHLMAAAHELGDIARAIQLTEATTRWLDAMPAAVLFRGICRVHRSQVLQFTGAWDQAEQEAQQVCSDLDDIAVATAAEAHYQVGELRRLRGDHDEAEAAYRRAHERGRDPQPGLALLRLAQGQTDAAAASIRGALIAERSDRLARARLLAAQVEIAVAAGDLDVARRAANELDSVATEFTSSGLQAAALHARGSVLLAEGRLDDALPVLREGCACWRDLEAPYDAARACVLLARTYQALEIGDSVDLELSAAAETFARLGAVAETRAVGELRGTPAHPDGLTGREVEVLALVAEGRTNRQVATALSISEKTVARHLSNIFAKVGVTSRTEAAAYAFAHGLSRG